MAFPGPYGGFININRTWETCSQHVPITRYHWEVFFSGYSTLKGFFILIIKYIAHIYRKVYSGCWQRGFAWRYSAATAAIDSYSGIIMAVIPFKYNYEVITILIPIPRGNIYDNMGVGRISCYTAKTDYPVP